MPMTLNWHTLYFCGSTLHSSESYLQTQFESAPDWLELCWLLKIRNHESGFYVPLQEMMALLFQFLFDSNSSSMCWNLPRNCNHDSLGIGMSTALLLTTPPKTFFSWWGSVLPPFLIGNGNAPFGDWDQRSERESSPQHTGGHATPNFVCPRTLLRRRRKELEWELKKRSRE